MHHTLSEPLDDAALSVSLQLQSDADYIHAACQQGHEQLGHTDHPGEKDLVNLDFLDLGSSGPGNGADPVDYCNISRPSVHAQLTMA